MFANGARKPASSHHGAEKVRRWDVKMRYCPPHGFYSSFYVLSDVRCDQYRASRGRNGSDGNRSRGKLKMAGTADF